ncbi:MAG TPA: aminotransferase class I/II-fold pyridoxal phosphate-dependent enzyme [Nitrososphaeraceae archaeon]|jgi:aspartate aminotransferase|nr:aminotransferase class I/II-fold pyridoxal phosphate-dependent enzyme [Nitrososphaeraceae archaeon]
MSDKKDKKEHQLEKLREDMRLVTADIIKLVQKRMSIAGEIGNIKNNLMMKIEDITVEQDIARYVNDLGTQVGLKTEFIGRLLNLLFLESIRIQKSKHSSKEPKIDHMVMFLKAKQLESEGKKIIHLEVGEPDYLPPVSVKNELSKTFDKKRVHYTQTTGVPILRKSLAKKRSVKEENVIVTPGARFAVFSAMVSTLSVGDEVIISEPAWPAYRDCANYIGVKVKAVKTNVDQNWDLNLDQLEQMITPNTKMIVLNSPNNPTGKIVGQQQIDAVLALAGKNDIYVLSDEVYSMYSYVPYKSILDFKYNKSIMVSSFSKSHAMTGFRVGYAISAKDIIDKISKIQAIAITSVAEPMQYAAVAALNADVTKNKILMKKRLDFIGKQLENLPCDYINPDGGMYYFVRFNKNVDVNKTIFELLNEGVAVAPGAGFGEAYSDFIRISACQPIKSLNDGLKIIRKITDLR